MAELPHLYANGFAISVTSSDVTMVLEQNGRAIATVNMSYTVAKTLSMKLGGGIGSLEEATKRSMLTTDEVEKLMKDSK